LPLVKPAAPKANHVNLVKMELFHGTDAHLRPGDVILPGNVIGRKNHQLSKDGIIYLSQEEGMALIFANDFKRPGKTPKVYLVEPVEARKVESHIHDSHEWVALQAEVIRRVV